MDSLLPARATAPNSQCVNYREASGIQIYAKLRSLQINAKYSMSKRPLLAGNCKPMIIALVYVTETDHGY